MCVYNTLPPGSWELYPSYVHGMCRAENVLAAKMRGDTLEDCSEHDAQSQPAIIYDN